ncbi:uncharacterized protein [Anser cygnoides]|uniref:uncharacterized protein n=1 Tax=Anser cygnoides TaxID=8845 RepID=UPI002009101A|nr:neuromedin-U isoform X4 [Anser cygnoides]
MRAFAEEVQFSLFPIELNHSYFGNWDSMRTSQPNEGSCKSSPNPIKTAKKHGLSKNIESSHLMFGDNWVSPELITGFSSPGLWHFITRELIPHQMWLIAAEKISVDGGHTFCDDAEILFVLGVIRRNFKRILPCSLTVDVFGQLVLTEQMLAYCKRLKGSL